MGLPALQVERFVIIMGKVKALTVADVMSVANAPVKPDEVRNSLSRVFAAIDRGESVWDAMGSKDSKAVVKFARLAGVAQVYKREMENATAVGTMRVHAGSIVKYAATFEQVVKAKADAIKNGESSLPVLLVLSPNGIVTPEEFDSNEQAAKAFLACKKAANLGRIADCGIGFAVVYAGEYGYKPGFTKTVFLMPLEAAMQTVDAELEEAQATAE
jgi:hypothetical protein